PRWKWRARSVHSPGPPGGSPMSRRTLLLFALLAVWVVPGQAQGPPAITLFASPAGSSPFGQAVTLTAETQGIPQGSTIRFLDGTTQIGTATTANNTATFTTTNLAVGTRSLAATFTPAAGGQTTRSNTLTYVVKATTNTDVTS